MSDDELVRLRPRDLAVVWGRALGQLIELWRMGLRAPLELGSAEDESINNAIDGVCNQITVQAVDGQVPALFAQDLVGLNFGETLDSQCVTFTPAGPVAPGFSGAVLVDCCVDEACLGQVTGDTYQGQVVDERGAPVADIALEAGS
jgi:hypothetical protein